MGTMGPPELSDVLRQLHDAEAKVVAMKVAAGINPHLATEFALVDLRQMRASVANSATQGAELLELLRQASPPFGATSERREQWKRRRDEVVSAKTEGA